MPKKSDIGVNKASRKLPAAEAIGAPDVAENLERLINAGELVGGDRINESGLAQSLNTGRGPVREACRMLERAGLVRSVVNRGFFVQEIGLKEALDICEVRAALFRTAGRLLVERITQAQLRALSALVDEMDRAAEVSDFHNFYQLNEAFHNLIICNCGNASVTELWSRLQSQLNLFRRRRLVFEGALVDANDEHRAIVEALERGDVTATALLSERHLLSGKARLLATTSEEPLGTRRRHTSTSITDTRDEITTDPDK